MYTQISTYPVAVTQGDSNQFVAQVTNKGNQTAHGVDLNWTLPSGWSITSGTASVSQSTLAIDATLANTVTVLIPTNATTGNQTVTATADTDGNSQKTRSASVTVLVQAKSTDTNTTTNTTTTVYTPGGGGSSGGSSGSSIFQNPEQAQAFFKTSQETFELLRGKDASFSISIQNPFEDKGLQGIRVSVSGLLAKYLQLTPTDLGDFLPGQEKKLDIRIIAPKYFTSGTHTLSFAIEGNLLEKKGNQTVSRAFKEERKVTLVIREVDRTTANGLLQQAQQAIDAMREQGWETEKLESLQRQARQLLLAKEYDSIPSLVEQILDQASLAESINQKIVELEEQIQQAKQNGLDAPKTIRLLELVKLAFKRGDYTDASRQIEDAGTVFLLETKGAVNLTFFVLNHWKALSASGAALVAIIFFGLLFARNAWLSNRITVMKKEENLLLGLIKSAQNQCFVEKKISMNEYYDTITHFERKLSRVAERSLQLENEQTNLFKFKSKANKLREEREHLLGIIKKTQEDYFNKGIIETRVYQARTKSLMERYSTVEKNIVLHDTLKDLRLENSRIKPFWKVYYKVFR
jgi:hypothetical protein